MRWRLRATQRYTGQASARTGGTRSTAPAACHQGRLERSSAAIASGPAAVAPVPGCTHCTASAHCAVVSPSASRSANCHGTIRAGVGTRRSANCAHEVQKAQSPSYTKVG
jgi:hypothetical protein